MDLSENQLRRVSTLLVGFFGDFIGVEGEITLPATIGAPSQQSITYLPFHYHLDSLYILYYPWMPRAK